MGIDPGVATGMVAIADGKVIEEGNCFSIKELITRILKILRNVNFEVTSVSVKIGNGVPFYKEILEGLDSDLPPQAAIEEVGEAGTNKPLKENNSSRRVRHISSAIHMAGRNGKVVPRRKIFAAHSRIQ
ncbi:MAG TPA: hypothetical protein VF350_08500 [Candidatus Bathyarchaeia archaeon]